ncbi:MAG: fimbrial protein [Pseudomonadota bacterium]
MADKMTSGREEEEPLDPAVEAIRVKMVRLLMVSGGIMMLGLMAVLAVIVYKVTSADEAGQGAQPSAPVADKAVPVGGVRPAYVGIPKGAEIVSAVPDGAGVFITLRKTDGSIIMQRHNGAGQLVASFAVVEE